MIKVGILTFQRAHNHGAVLQAYALLTTLKNMGYDAEVVDYWPSYRDGHYSLFNHENKFSLDKSFSANVKQTVLQTLNFPNHWKRHYRFNRFIKSGLKVGNKPFQKGVDTPDKYDVIICGSDQIWRYDFRGSKGFDQVYFAKYPANKKVVKLSYAASMGDKDLNDAAKKELSGLLEHLDFISVREDSLMDLIRSVTSKPPVQVLDPAFLLSETEWRTIVKKTMTKKRYLLFYQLLKDPNAAKLAKKIAHERQLELIEIRGLERAVNPFKARNLNLSAGPVDFISLIAHADYVVATSYHGIVFSIIFQKPFSALGFRSNGYRIKSLLKSFDLEHCLVDATSTYESVAINYNAITLRLQEMAKSSAAFLKESIGKSKPHQR